MFLNWFRFRKANAGKIMEKQDVVRSILTKLDAKQNAILEIAMNELSSTGLIEVQPDGVTLVLTQKGADALQK